MSIPDLLPIVSHEEGSWHFKEVVEQGSAIGKPIQYRRKDGSIGWWIVNAVKLSEERMLGFIKDVTEMMETQKQLEESQRRLTLAQEIALVGDWVLELSTKKIWASAETFKVYGIERFSEYLPLEVVQESVVLEYRNLLNEKLANLIAEKDNYNVIFLIRKKGTQEESHIHSIAYLEKDENGKPVKVIGTIQDITEHKRKEKELSESEEKFRKSIEEAPVPIMLHADDGEVLELNRTLSELTGYQQKDIPTMKEWIEKAYEPENTEIREVIESLNSIKERQHDGEYSIKTKNGTVLIWDFYSANIGKLMDGRKIIMSVATDSTEDKERQKELLFISFHDQLTGLYNRRFYEEELSRVDTARNLPLSLVLCDVNGLKLINDSFGHAVGDQLLVKAANALTAGCRTDDLIARHGGDEFVIILPRTSSSEVEAILKRIKSEVDNEQIESLAISISFGYETKTDIGQDIRDILKAAEDHMYRHKLYESGSARSKTVNLIINTLYEKNNREMLHSQRVSDLCGQIAKASGMGRDDVNQMRIAGLMHDIGKIGIAETILNKVEALSSDEWEEIKRHSEIGYRILSSVSEFSEIANFVLEHQEKWDGTGYPKGLKAEAISIEARIITLADSYDAMTGTRTYRDSLTKDEAILEIKKNAGTQFDPALAKIFIENVLELSL